MSVTRNQIGDPPTNTLTQAVYRPIGLMPTMTARLDLECTFTGFKYAPGKKVNISRNIVTSVFE
jgi:hypothetical protein